MDSGEKSNLNQSRDDSNQLQSKGYTRETVNGKVPTGFDPKTEEFMKETLTMILTLVGEFVDAFPGNLSAQISKSILSKGGKSIEFA